MGHGERAGAERGIAQRSLQVAFAVVETQPRGGVGGVVQGCGERGEVGLPHRNTPRGRQRLRLFGEPFGTPGGATIDALWGKRVIEP